MWVDSIISRLKRVFQITEQTKTEDDSDIVDADRIEERIENLTNSEPIQVIDESEWDELLAKSE